MNESEPSPPPDGARTPRTALLLCNNEEVRGCVAYWLSGAGVDVTIASEPNAVSLHLAGTRFDLLVFDGSPAYRAGLPGLLQMKRVHRLRIVLVADGGDSAPPHFARALGVDAVLERPLRQSRLLRAAGAWQPAEA